MKRARTTPAGPSAPAFRRWFRGSEVVHKDGSPRIVYHGTRSPVDFDVFRFGTQSAADGAVLIGGGGDASAFLGPHFAESHVIASAFACGGAADWDRHRRVAPGDCGGRVIPVYLAIRNPNVFEDDEAMIRGFDGIYASGRSRSVEEEMVELYGRRVVRGLDDPNGRGPSRPEAVAAALRKMDEEGWVTGRGEPSSTAAKRELAASAVRAWRREGYDGVRYWNSIEPEELGLEALPEELQGVLIALGLLLEGESVGLGPLRQQRAARLAAPVEVSGDLLHEADAAGALLPGGGLARAIPRGLRRDREQLHIGEDAAAPSEGHDALGGPGGSGSPPPS